MDIAQKERIRGPALAVFARYSKSMPMEETLRKVDESALVIASNKRIDEMLLGCKDWHKLNCALPCWTGTVFGYDLPDKRLGKTIEYLDSKTEIRYVFPVPEEHQGKRDVLLVAEHPDFILESDGNNRIVLAGKVGIVEGFPITNGGYYRADQQYAIPYEVPIDSSNREARRLWRTDKMISMVGRVYHDSKNVTLSNNASFKLGVIVEAAIV